MSEEKKTDTNELSEDALEQVSGGLARSLCNNEVIEGVVKPKGAGIPPAQGIILKVDKSTV